MLKKHVAFLNDPFLRKLEVMLGLFGQQTHANKTQNRIDMKITDYLMNITFGRLILPS